MILAPRSTSAAETLPLKTGDVLPRDVFQTIRRKMVLESCKWDPQVGDVSTISPFPLLLSESNWHELSQQAAWLTSELLAAEQELLDRPELHCQLGLPRRLRSVLRRAKKIGATPATARVMRFDFHWTADGWRISEVNSDVPGGFSEASELPLLMTPHYPGARAAGNPGAAWADAIDAAAPRNRPIAHLAAPGFLEDQQVLAYLDRQFCKRKRSTIWASQDDLRWRDGWCYLNSKTDVGSIGAVIRFYQAEWLAHRSCAALFVGGRTPVANPGVAVLTESKRFPLVWDQLKTALPTWRTLLPTTVDVRDVDWQQNDSWLLKSAFCNTGDTVTVRALMTDQQWRSTARAVRRRPGAWIAQKKFATRPLQSPTGPIYPCLGVYTVDGQAAGIYGRFSRTPVIDYRAVDAAVLITAN
jgi:glutathionylspermidine synthase